MNNELLKKNLIMLFCLYDMSVFYPTVLKGYRVLSLPEGGGGQAGGWACGRMGGQTSPIITSI